MCSYAYLLRQLCNLQIKVYYDRCHTCRKAQSTGGTLNFHFHLLSTYYSGSCVTLIVTYSSYMEYSCKLQVLMQFVNLLILYVVLGILFQFQLKFIE